MSIDFRDALLHPTVADVYAAGEVTGVGGVDKAVLEGRLAAHALHGNEPAAAALARPHAKALSFVRRLKIGRAHV